MALNLTKGQGLNLTKAAPGLNNIRLGLGWEIVSAPLDLDVSCFMLNADGKCPNEGSVVFFNQLTSADGSIKHQGDNRTGAGDGDDEVIDIDLSKVSPDINEISVVVSIYDARTKQQDFSKLKNAYIRIVNQADGSVLTQYDLDESFPGKYAVQVGSLVREPVGSWTFQAVGVGFEKDFAEIVAVYL